MLPTATVILHVLTNFVSFINLLPTNKYINPSCCCPDISKSAYSFSTQPSVPCQTPTLEFLHNTKPQSRPSSNFLFPFSIQHQPLQFDRIVWHIFGQRRIFGPRSRIFRFFGSRLVCFGLWLVWPRATMMMMAMGPGGNIRIHVI